MINEKIIINIEKFNWSTIVCCKRFLHYFILSIFNEIFLLLTFLKLYLTLVAADYEVATGGEIIFNVENL